MTSSTDEEMVEGDSIELPFYERENPSAIPRIIIIEQPATTVNRFRYESERPSYGKILGRNFNHEYPAYPKIQVTGHTTNENILIIVSCVTNDVPYRPHPHNLVGPNCVHGVYKGYLDRTMSLTFSGLGIRRVQRKDIRASLELCKRMRVDPFNIGFDHASDDNFQFDLNCVRLCFQGYIIKGDQQLRLQPVVSEPIYKKKPTSSLQIIKLSHSSAPATGGTKITIWCKKVLQDEVMVKFSETSTNWEAFGVIISNRRETAIMVETPRYRNPLMDKKVEVEIRLMRIINGEVGEPLPFMFTPAESDKSQSSKSHAYERSDLLQHDSYSSSGSNIELQLNTMKRRRQSKKVPLQL